MTALHRLLVLVLSGSLVLSRPAGAQEPASATPTDAALDPLEALLDERALKSTTNPVVASFLAAEGATLVPEELRERSRNQLRSALKNQTSFMTVMLAGMTGMMNSDSMK